MSVRDLTNTRSPHMRNLLEMLPSDITFDIFKLAHQQLYTMVMSELDECVVQHVVYPPTELELQVGPFDAMVMTPTDMHHVLENHDVMVDSVHYHLNVHEGVGCYGYTIPVPGMWIPRTMTYRIQRHLMKVTTISPLYGVKTDGGDSTPLNERCGICNWQSSLMFTSFAYTNDYFDLELPIEIVTLVTEKVLPQQAVVVQVTRGV